MILSTTRNHLAPFRYSPFIPLRQSSLRNMSGYPCKNRSQSLQPEPGISLSPSISHSMLRFWAYPDSTFRTRSTQPSGTISVFPPHTSLTQSSRSLQMQQEWPESGGRGFRGMAYSPSFPCSLAALTLWDWVRNGETFGAKEEGKWGSSHSVSLTLSETHRWESLLRFPPIIQGIFLKIFEDFHQIHLILFL